MDMKTLKIVSIISLLMSFTAEANFAWVKIRSVKLKESGDLLGKGEITLCAKGADSKSLCANHTPVGLKDNTSTKVNLHQVYIPLSARRGESLQLDIQAFDLDETTTENVGLFSLNLSPVTSQVKKLSDGKGNELEIEITVRDYPNLNQQQLDREFSAFHTNKILRDKIQTFKITSGAKTDDCTNTLLAAGNFRSAFALRKEVLAMLGTKHYESLRDAYNDRILVLMGQTLVATDWVNEETAALPNGLSLIIE